MIPNQFSEKLKEMIARDNAILSDKEHEYSSNRDRFDRFTRAAVLLNTTPQEAALGMAVKHLTAIIDIVQDVRGYSPGKIQKRFSNARNYLYLIEAIISEEINGLG